MNASSAMNLKWLFILVVFTISVIILTHLPQNMMPVILSGRVFDKVMHIAAYGTITYLFIMSFKAFHNSMFNLILLLIILILAATDELTQSFIDRTPSLYDWISDIIGWSFAQIIFFYQNRVKYIS